MTSAASETTPRRPPSRVSRGRAASNDFFRRVVKKAEQDQIFFMAGAIAFNVLVAVIPLALAAVGIAGFILQYRYEGAPSEPLLRMLLQALPPLNQETAEAVRDALTGVIASSRDFFTIGTLIFIWIATRLVGTLRAALREIFDIQQDRGIVAGKLFDIKMVLVAGTLLAINIALTFAADLAAGYGTGLLGLSAAQLRGFGGFYRLAAAFTSIWFMFVLIYRYLPFRRIQWRTALIAATFTAVLFEVMKQAFAWYAREVAVYSSTYGNLSTIAIVVIWVYYMAIAFILGGEVGQVAALRRIRRQQKERLG